MGKDAVNATGEQSVQVKRVKIIFSINNPVTDVHLAVLRNRYCWISFRKTSSEIGKCIKDSWFEATEQLHQPIHIEHVSFEWYEKGTHQQAIHKPIAYINR